MVNHAQYFDHCMISINRLINRKKDFSVKHWILDSAAFTRISTHGEHLDLNTYAEQINRWSCCGVLDAAVTQDYMCEPFILKKTGKTIKEHQLLTVERYVELVNKVKTYVMPVLQGWQAQDYIEHIEMYGDLLYYGQWVGVGSVCKRNTNQEEILGILSAIKSCRPDFKLHGFGLKTTSLKSSLIRELLFSSDSMAWSYAARREGKDANSYLTALDWAEKLS